VRAVQCSTAAEIHAHITVSRTSGSDAGCTKHVKDRTKGEALVLKGGKRGGLPSRLVVVVGFFQDGVSVATACTSTVVATTQPTATTHTYSTAYSSHHLALVEAAHLLIPSAEGSSQNTS
jgi:hypothetical protein